MTEITTDSKITTEENTDSKITTGEDTKVTTSSVPSFDKERFLASPIEYMEAHPYIKIQDLFYRYIRILGAEGKKDVLVSLIESEKITLEQMKAGVEARGYYAFTYAVKNNHLETAEYLKQFIVLEDRTDFTGRDYSTRDLLQDSLAATIKLHSGVKKLGTKHQAWQVDKDIVKYMVSFAQEKELDMNIVLSFDDYACIRLASTQDRELYVYFMSVLPEEHHKKVYVSRDRYISRNCLPDVRELIPSH